VVLVEPPAGSPTRGLRPFAGDIADPDRSLFHLTFNTNKRSVVLDLEDSGGRAQFERLVVAADVVADSFPPGKLESMGLEYARLREVNPRIVLTSITPFGGTGPYSGYKGPELIAQALGGLLYPWGDPEQRPSMMPQ
jgi:crotonobetainyl-CoA:carnitine CoA-transferase CaiB-like acyl-CoA transferase